MADLQTVYDARKNPSSYNFDVYADVDSWWQAHASWLSTASNLKICDVCDEESDGLRFADLHRLSFCSHTMCREAVEDFVLAHPLSWAPELSSLIPPEE